MNFAEAEAPVADTGTVPLRFIDRPGLLGLLLKNLGLTIITLGLYRFWARTSLRRYWWSSVEIDGDALEYAGTGAELFLGFLFFLILISPFGLVWGVLKIFVANPLYQGLVGLAFYLFLFFILIPVALFRARRYRLSRTRWRGIRGGMEGSTLRFVLLAIGGTFATLFSLGILAPWMRLVQARYMINCSSFGDQKMSFDGRSGGLIWRWAVAMLVPAVLFILLAIDGTMFVIAHQTAGPPTAPPSPALLIFDIALEFLAVLAFVVGYIWYSVVEFRYILNHTMIGGMRFRSMLRPWSVVGFVIAFFIVVGICVSIMASILIVIVMLILIGIGYLLSGQFVVASSPAMIGGFILVYALAIAVMGIARVLILDKEIVRMIIRSASLGGGVEGLARIRQSTAPLPGTGEGMADAFDIGAF